MKRAHAFRPTIHPLEDRTALSFSFSNLLHSLFPFVKDDSDDVKPRHALRGHVARPGSRPHGLHTHPFVQADGGGRPGLQAPAARGGHPGPRS